MMFSQKGQTFAPFRLLIGAIMALLVLVIIVSAINYFQDLRFNVSQQKFFNGLSNAINQPNSSVLIVEDVQFRKESIYSSNGFSKVSGIEPECITFMETDSLGIEVEDQVIKFNQNILTNVYYKCEIPNNGICEISCEIAFNESDLS
ncbi:MAG: hypothetical protein NUV57_02415 [archaeon]|nr:hypothetical protein [archaeon]